MFLFSIIQCASASEINSHCDNIQIISKELSMQEAEAYCQYAASERAKVEAFWGPTWKEPIRIHVDSSYRVSRALLMSFHGNRGFMEMPLRRVKNNDGALLHEIVHIYAPNSNRFLAEGIAVYLQAKLGGNPAIPNFGKDLNILARDIVPRFSSLEDLDNAQLAQPTRKGTYLIDESVYIVSGSFVGFLIEKYGLAKFKNCYETGDYSKTYGKSLKLLDEEWRSWVQGN